MEAPDFSPGSGALAPRISAPISAGFSPGIFDFISDMLVPPENYRCELTTVQRCPPTLCGSTLNDPKGRRDTKLSIIRPL